MYDHSRHTTPIAHMLPQTPGQTGPFFSPTPNTALGNTVGVTGAELAQPGGRESELSPAEFAWQCERLTRFCCACIAQLAQSGRLESQPIMVLPFVRMRQRGEVSPNFPPELEAAWQELRATGRQHGLDISLQYGDGHTPAFLQVQPHAQ